MTALARPVPGSVPAAVPRPSPPVRVGGRSRRDPLRLRLPGRTVLLVAGMPGSGKSTLLARVAARPGLVVLDSDAQRTALAGLLPGLAYRRYRPLVHLLHRLALVRASFSAVPTVVVHLPATATATRLAIALLALLTGRDAHLLWLHADPAQARAGQRDRGRVVPSGSFARHARRAAATHRRLLRGRRDGFRTATVLDRAGPVLDTYPVQ